MTDSPGRRRVQAEEMDEFRPVTDQYFGPTTDGIIRELIGESNLAGGPIPWYKRGWPAFLIGLAGWLWGAGLLGHNIYLGFRDGDFLDVYLTIFFHSISCLMLAGFEYSNLLVVPGGFAKFARKPAFLIFKLFCDLLTLWKPFWCYKTYRESQDRHGLIREGLNAGNKITREDIQKLVDNQKDELEIGHFKLTEAFVKNVPMAILQMFLWRDTNFGLCIVDDWNRLAMILTAVFSSAKATSGYAKKHAAYLKHLHFLDDFFSTHKISGSSSRRFQGQSILSMSLLFLCHLLLSVHRFYAIFFFVTVRPWLVPTFILALFLSHWLLLEIVPALRMTLDNPPHGVATLFSNLIDRWINVFNAHMIRFTSARIHFIKMSKFRIPIPFWMGLLQLIPFILSISVVCLVHSFWWPIHEVMEETFVEATSNLSIISAAVPHHQNNTCAHSTILSHIGLDNNNQVIGWMGLDGEIDLNLNIESRQVSFGHLLGTFNFLTFSVALYMAACAFLTLYLHFFEVLDNHFPVQTAYNFWRSLLDLQDPNTREQRDWRDKFTASKFMALTLMPDSEFQKILWRWRLSFFLCGKGGSEGKWHSIFWSLSVTERERSFEEIQRSFSNHPMRYCLESFRVDCRTLAGVNGAASMDHQFARLVNKFFREFDDRMKKLSSYRIAKTFTILGEKLAARVDDDD